MELFIFIFLVITIVFILFIFRHKRIETQIVINHPIEHVWQIFTSTSSYSQWNTLFSIDEFPKYVGQKIDVNLYDSNNNLQLRMCPIIKTLGHYQLAWEGKIYIDGLFNGKHQFTFKKIDHNSTLLIHAEDFNGVLVPLLNYFVIKLRKNEP